MDSLEHACEYTNDVLYKKSEIKKFQKELLGFFIVICLSFLAVNITRPLVQKDSSIRKISVEKSK